MSYINSYCRIVPGHVEINKETYFESTDKPFVMNNFFSAIYEHAGIDYRRFFKMDALSKLGFLASELLLAGSDREHPKQDMGIILFNRSSSLGADWNYQKTIQDKNNFFPSPAEFVYTLPNIVTGEIAIRNKIYGETVFYILPHFEIEICEHVNNTLYDAGIDYVLAGWIEVDVFNNTVDCLMMLCTSKPGRMGVNKRIPFLPEWLKGVCAGEVMELNEHMINKIYNNLKYIKQ